MRAFDVENNFVMRFLDERTVEKYNLALRMIIVNARGFEGLERQPLKYKRGSPYVQCVCTHPLRPPRRHEIIENSCRGSENNTCSRAHVIHLHGAR